MTALTQTAAAEPARVVHRRLTEDDWRAVWSACPARVAVALPAWARPLRRVGAPAPVGDSPEAAGARPDPAAQSLVTLAGRATTLLELRASAGSRGVLGGFAVAGGPVVGVVRELLSPDGTRALRPLAGLTLTELDVGGLVDAVMALVPPAREVQGRRNVRLPAEQSIALCDASRHEVAELLAAMTAELGIGPPLGVLEALARGIVGSLDIRVGSCSRAAGAFASWTLTDEGWVWMQARGDHVTHAPVGRDDIRGRVLAEITGRLGDDG